MSSSNVWPWKPATMTILPSFTALRIFSSPTCRRCGPCRADLVGDDAHLGTGEADGVEAQVLDGDGKQGDGLALAGGQRPPSISRSSGWSVICIARAMRSSVVSPGAETTTTSEWPSWRLRTMRSATVFMWAGVAARIVPSVLMDDQRQGSRCLQSHQASAFSAACCGNSRSIESQPASVLAARGGSIGLGVGRTAPPHGVLRIVDEKGHRLQGVGLQLQRASNGQG